PNRGRSRRDGRKGLAAQIDVEIFTLDGPLRRKAPLKAGAGGPASSGVGHVGGVQRTYTVGGKEAVIDIAVREAGGPVEQESVNQSEAGPATDGAEPLKTLPRLGDDRKGRNGSVDGSADVGGLKISFEAEHEAACLPVVANLATGQPTLRLRADGVRDERREGAGEER